MSEQLQHWEIEWLLQWRADERTAKHCLDCHALSIHFSLIPDVVEYTADDVSVVYAVPPQYADLITQAREHMQARHPWQLESTEV